MYASLLFFSLNMNTMYRPLKRGIIELTIFSQEEEARWKLSIVTVQHTPPSFGSQSLAQHASPYILVNSRLLLSHSQNN